MRRILRPEWHTPGGFRILTFDSKADLFNYIRSFDYKDRKKGIHRGNHFLEAVMCNPNDSRRHEHKFLFRHNTKSSYEWSYYLGYLTKDIHGRVIDLRHHIDDLYSFDRRAYKMARRDTYDMEWQVKRAKQDALWAKQNPRWAEQEAFRGSNRVYNYSKDLWWLPCRYPRTWQERRFAVIPEHKPYVPGKRSIRMLPELWKDELQYVLQRSWKSQTKVKRQWLVNKKTHIDTIKNTNFKRMTIDLSNEE